MSQQHTSSVGTRTREEEVARLLSQIEKEHRMKVWGAKEIVEPPNRRLYLTRRQKAIDAYQAQLSQLVGTLEAARLVGEILMQIPTQKSQTPYTRPLE